MTVQCDEASGPVTIKVPQMVRDDPDAWKLVWLGKVPMYRNKNTGQFMNKDGTLEPLQGGTAVVTTPVATPAMQPTMSDDERAERIRLARRLAAEADASKRAAEAAGAPGASGSPGRQGVPGSAATASQPPAVSAGSAPPPTAGVTPSRSSARTWANIQTPTLRKSKIGPAVGASVLIAGALLLIWAAK